MGSHFYVGAQGRLPRPTSSRGTRRVKVLNALAPDTTTDAGMKVPLSQTRIELNVQVAAAVATAATAHAAVSLDFDTDGAAVTHNDLLHGRLDEHAPAGLPPEHADTSRTPHAGALAERWPLRTFSIVGIMARAMAMGPPTG
jgi:hypothetical protein